MSDDERRPECFGVVTILDKCLQCPYNEECVTETIRRIKQKMKCPKCGYKMKKLTPNFYRCQTDNCSVHSVEIHFRQPILDAIVKEASEK